MDEEIKEQQEEQQEQGVDDIWKLIGLDDPDSDDQKEDNQYEDIEEEQEEQIAKIDKTLKKYTSKMDERMKELDRKILRERVKRFTEEADPVERDLFKAVASDISTPEEFDKAVDLAKKNAAKIKEEAEKYLKQAEEEARKKASEAWGMAPVSAVQRGEEYEKKRDERIQKGDISALTDFLIEGTPLANR